jgi:hypothetical protein
MPITYSISELESIIVEVWVGEITIVSLAEYWRDYLKAERVLATRRTLVDLTRARIAFSKDELQLTVEQVVAPVLAGRDWITAMVVKNVDQFRAGAQYQVIAQFYSYDSIFSDWEAAMTWLRKQELRVP